ncbi:unnamed protein product [Cunninghamella echinulata]
MATTDIPSQHSSDRDSMNASPPPPPEESCNIQQFMCSFLKQHTAYDVLPVSYRLIVFDTHLLVKKALAALVQNGIVSAPLWDSATQNYAGMLTVADFQN